MTTMRKQYSPKFKAKVTLETEINESVGPGKGRRVESWAHGSNRYGCACR